MKTLNSINLIDTVAINIHDISLDPKAQTGHSTKKTLAGQRMGIVFAEEALSCLPDAVLFYL